MPFGVAPNFLINEKFYSLPMTIEESSVVAAASNAAKFWLTRGGFKQLYYPLKKLDIFTLHLREKKSLKTVLKI